MSLVTLTEAQARVSSDITQDQIDEAEEWLTGKIGPLIGERTETFFLSRRRHKLLAVDGLWLRRKTDAATVVNYEASTDTSGTILTASTDYRLIDHLLIERNPDSEVVWGATMDATYEPNDEETVRSIIYDLLHFRQNAESTAGLQSVRIGAYSETYFPAGQTHVEPAILKRALPTIELGEFNDPFRYRVYRRDRTLVTGTGS